MRIIICSFILLFCCSATFPESSSFSLVESLKAVALETNADQKIASYKIIAQHITELDSIRLTKRFMKFVKQLDEEAEKDPDRSIRYKELLRCMTSNKAIKRLDLKHEFSTLLIKYKSLVPNDIYTKITIPVIHQDHTDLYEDVIVPDIVQPDESQQLQKPTTIQTITPIIKKPERKQQKIEAPPQEFDKDHVINSLLLYEIKKQLREIHKEIKVIKKECSELANETPSRQQIFLKLLYLEQLLETDKELTQKSRRLSSFLNRHE